MRDFQNRNLKGGRLWGNPFLWLTMSCLLFSNGPSYAAVGHRVMYLPAQNQPYVLEGAIKDTEGTPLSGVTITVKGTSTSTSTDDQGLFTLELPSAESTVVVSHVGFETQELAAHQARDIVLFQAQDVLEPVVVVGFGTQKKRDLTGSITQVNAEQINARPVANLGQALKGLIPNLNVSVGSGSPNASTSLNVRGTTSMSYDQNNDRYVTSSGSPLILVDGVQMDFNNLNPEDIESVTTLKDASASAIYGARAAFGVVLITTKSGKSGRSSVNYSNSFQWSNPTAVPDIMNAYDLQDAYIKGFELQNGQSAGQQEWDKLREIEAYMADPENTSPYFLDASGNPIWVANVNPYQEALAKTAPMQKHNLSFSGGNEKVTYYVSTGYQQQAGIYKLNTDKLHRYNMIANLGVRINDWFRIDTRNNYALKKYQEPVSPAGKSGWWAALAHEPSRNVNMPLFTPEDSPVGRMYTDNILSFMDYGSSNKTDNEQFLIMLNPTITPLPGWNIKSDLSYKVSNSKNKQVIPELNRVEPGSWSIVNSHTSPSSVYDSRSRSNQYTINVYTDYSTVLGDDHNLSGVLGYNQEWYDYNSVWVKKTDITDGIDYIEGASGVITAADNFYDWAVRGVFYRLSYDYQGKYLFQSNGRYDGSSRFARSGRFKFFPSFSAGWVVSQERFASNWDPYVSFFKIRGSYGSIGNQNVGYYDYISTFNQGQNLNYELGGIRPSYINVPELVDMGYTWETATTVNLGADINLFENIEINFDWYRRRTTDILTDGASYPAVLGAEAPVSNTGELQSQGWELIIKYANQTKGGLGYDAALTLGDYQSKVITYQGNDNYLLSKLYSGYRIGDIWGYQTYGLFQDEAELEAVNPAQTQKDLSSLWFPGDVRYTDLNGDGEITSGNNTLNDPGDRRIIGNSTPRYSFGLNGNIRYKGFDFNIFLQGVGKRDIWIGNNLYWGAGATGTYAVYNNSWRPDNPGAKYPGYYSAGKNRQIQTRFLEDGRYLRIKNIALGYTLPNRYTQAIKFQNVRLSLSAFNLMEFKRLPETYDPELTGLNYPIMRSFAFGLQATF